jgi:capsular exopolysaccharide synthesis family protein
MKKSLRYYASLARRWTWVVILGIVLCSSAAFVFSKKTTPVYQASATLILSMRTTTSAFDNVNTSVLAVPTYAQLLTSPSVLTPVVTRHRGLTLQTLSQMITVTPQTNTQLIELAVENTNPQLAMQLANEISQSFQEFVNSQLPGTIEILPAQAPITPVRPKVLANTGIGAVAGLCLALAMIVVFEWIDGRLTSPEEIQEALGVEILAFFPQLTRKRRANAAQNTELLAQGCRRLAVSFDVAQRTMRPFKLVMITSALAGEGKTTIAARTASFLAAAGKRVLLVDANLHNPAVEQHFQLGQRDPLEGTETQAEIHLNGQITNMPTLRVLTAEAFAPSFTRALRSLSVNQLVESFKEAPFDYVLFDTSALLHEVDMQILASYVQATVVVVNPAQTPRKAALRMMHLLKNLDSLVVGAVINKSPWQDYAGTMSLPRKEAPSPIDIESSITVPMPVTPPPTAAHDLALLDTHPLTQIIKRPKMKRYMLFKS